MEIGTSVVFTGDIGFDKYMSGRFTDDGLLSPEILRFFAEADHVVANVEGALFDAPPEGRGDYFHAMDPRAVRVLKKMHADVWCIANNHSMDAGREGLVSTLSLAKAENVRTIGAGLDIDAASAPVILPGAGGIGLVAVGYRPDCVAASRETPGCFMWDDAERIAARIQEIKKTCRWCVVVVHGGEEFAPVPSPYTRERYLSYLDTGADIVVGHHPHVPENYEFPVPGKAIFYSLGNFIFDTDYQRAHRYTDTGVLLKLNFTEDSFSFEAIGTRIDRVNETIAEGPLPKIFVPLGAEEYDALIPLAARAFLSEERRRMVYLEPERFRAVSPKDWKAYCASDSVEGYVRDEHMDLSVIYKLAALPFRPCSDSLAVKDAEAYMTALL